MKRRHIAFCLEQAYGHIIPTLGITLELVRRGHRVSYAVTKNFAPAVVSCKATPVFIEPIDTRADALSVIDESKYLEDKARPTELKKRLQEISHRRTIDSLAQLERQYCDEKPDLIIHDDCLDTAGREFASKWGIANVMHVPIIVDANSVTEWFGNTEIVLVSTPRFFQPHSDQLDRRFRFIGFNPQGRTEAFDPWDFSVHKGEKVILIAASTGLLAQTMFCRMMIDAFRKQPWQVVLSVAGAFDPISFVDAGQFSDVPANIRLNTSSATLEILGRSSLYIGQGGQGGVLEAIFCGVPQLLIPPTSFHRVVADRVAELGLGKTISSSGLCADELITQVSETMKDREIRQRVADAQLMMRRDGGAVLAVDIIEEYLSGRA